MKRSRASSSTELSTSIHYTEPMPLAYWRSTFNFEVDFVLTDTTAIEIKAKEPVDERDCAVCAP